MRSARQGRVVQRLSLLHLSTFKGESSMPSIQIKSETADLLRAAAPKLGLRPSDERETVAPGIEVVHLNEFEHLSLDTFRRAKKVSIDTAIQRIVKKVMA